MKTNCLSCGKEPDLIEPVRNILRKTDKPYVIENVEGARAKLINPILQTKSAGIFCLYG